MEMKVTTIAFIISVIILFAVLMIKNQYGAFLPLSFLYLIAFVTLLFVNFIGYLLDFHLSITYPFGFFLSLIALVVAISWFSDNPFTQTLKATFLNRKDIVSMADPYIVGNLIAYMIVLSKRSV